MRKLIVLLTLTGLAACSGEAPVSSDTTASQSQQPQVETASYNVLFGGTDVGDMTISQSGTLIDISYGFSNNGRGASSEETLLLSEAGLPISWKITGKTTFGNQVNETYEVKDGQASWTSAAGT